MKPSGLTNDLRDKRPAVPNIGQAHWLAVLCVAACGNYSRNADIVATAAPAAGVVAVSETEPRAAADPVSADAGTVATVVGPLPAHTTTNAGVGAGAGAGAGGVMSAGSFSAGAGSVADGGSDASAAMVAPSAGCTKQTPRPANGVVMQSDRIYTFPGAYDGTTPAPLLLALHAAGNPNTQLQRLTQGSRLETDFVRAFPKSAGSAWVYNTDVAKVDEVLSELLAAYCIDERRIFATGHSSGAQMIVQMLCKGEQRFRALAPVAASKYCAELESVAVLYIQGQMDAQRGGGNGEDVVRVFRSSNACAETSVPVTSVSSCVSGFDRKDVTPGCVSYEGCTAATLWCSHNDNGYNNSDGRQHGWPCFASEAIADFFLGF